MGDTMAFDGFSRDGDNGLKGCLLALAAAPWRTTDFVGCRASEWLGGLGWLWLLHHSHALGRVLVTGYRSKTELPRHLLVLLVQPREVTKGGGPLSRNMFI